MADALRAGHGELPFRAFDVWASAASWLATGELAAPLRGRDGRAFGLDAVRADPAPDQKGPCCPDRAEERPGHDGGRRCQ